MSDNTATNDPWIDDADVEPWSHTDSKRVPGTVTVQPTASNAYGPPIYLQIQRGEETASVWLDLDTWEDMYRAGLAAHNVRIEATERGWS